MAENRHLFEDFFDAILPFVTTTLYMAIYMLPSTSKNPQQSQLPLLKTPPFFFFSNLLPSLLQAFRLLHFSCLKLLYSLGKNAEPETGSIQKHSMNFSSYLTSHFCCVHISSQLYQCLFCTEEELRTLLSWFQELSVHLTSATSQLSASFLSNSDIYSYLPGAKYCCSCTTLYMLTILQCQISAEFETHLKEKLNCFQMPFYNFYQPRRWITLSN